MATTSTTVPVTRDAGTTSSVVPTPPTAATGDTSAGFPTVTSTPTAGLPAAPLPIALKVSFTLNTTDGLREISLGLEKDTDGFSTNWTLTFVLFERTDAAVDFGRPVVSLVVFLKVNQHANAEFAAHNGMTASQAAHATGPAADAAKAANDGNLSMPVAQRVVSNTFSS